MNTPSFLLDRSQGSVNPGGALPDDDHELGLATSSDEPELPSGLQEAPPEIWRRFRDDGDLAARETLIGHYLPYARMVAATVYARRIHNEIEFDEYFQLACVGMVESIDRFDPGHGVLFRTFASRRVRGAILNGLVRLTEKNQQISVKVRLRQERLAAVKDAAREEIGDLADGTERQHAERLFRYLAEVGIGIALGVLLEDTAMVDAKSASVHDHVSSPEVSYFREAEVRQLRSALQEMVGQLSTKERFVIQHHYLQEVPFEEIASRMGVTRGRVSQLHKQALLRLREFLSGDVRCDVSL